MYVCMYVCMYAHKIYKLCNIYIVDSSNQKDIINNSSPSS